MVDNLSQKVCVILNMQNRWSWFLSTLLFLSFFFIFCEPEGLKPNASYLSIPALRPRLKWWEIQFKEWKKKKKKGGDLALHHSASPLSLLHPHLRGRSQGAKSKPDGLIGPKDNKYCLSFCQLETTEAKNLRVNKKLDDMSKSCLIR